MVIGIFLGLAGLYAAYRIGNAVVGLVVMALPLVILAGAWMGGGPTSIVSTIAILGGTALIGWLFRSAGVCFLYSTVVSIPLWMWTLRYTQSLPTESDAALFGGLYALFFVPALWIISCGPLGLYFHDLPRVPHPDDRSGMARQRAFAKTGYLITKENGDYVIYRNEDDRQAGRRLVSGPVRTAVQDQAIRNG